MVYPVTLTEDPDSKQVMVRFQDVPEAITIGKDREDALSHALDALLVAISGYMDDGRLVPRPSKCARGEPFVALPVLAVAKVAVYEAMLEQGITQTELAARLGCDSRQVRRILDLDHHSRMDQMEAALKALGKRLAIEVQAAA